MYERLAEQRFAVYAVIHDEKVTPSGQRHLDLTPDQWDLLSQLVVVLKPLQVATTALCKEQNISSSLIYPVVNGLVKCHPKSDNADLVVVKCFKEVFTTELQHHFCLDPENVAVIAAVVDPCYHQLKFFNSEQQEQVNSILHQKAETLYVEQVHSEDTEPPLKRKKEETAMSFLLGAECDDSPRSNSWTDEIEQFQKEPRCIMMQML